MAGRLKYTPGALSGCPVTVWAEHSSADKDIWPRQCGAEIVDGSWLCAKHEADRQRLKR